MLNESNISNATYELPEELEIIEGWCGGSNIDIYPIKITKKNLYHGMIQIMNDYASMAYL